MHMARTGHDQREPKLEAADLARVAREAVFRMEPLARGAGIELRVEGEQAFATVDPEWLLQVLLALLSNSLKNSDRGSTVTLRAVSSSLTVEDEGIGMSEAVRSRAFDPFYKARPRREAEGFGLGLSICKDLVEKMEGSIFIESKKGVGTAVRIELPGIGADAPSKSTRPRRSLNLDESPDSEMEKTDDVGLVERPSERELEVLRLAARGMTNRQVAVSLYITEGTVKRHLANLYAKMGVKSRSEAVSKALAEGWISVGEIV